MIFPPIFVSFSFYRQSFNSQAQISYIFANLQARLGKVVDILLLGKDMDAPKLPYSPFASLLFKIDLL